MCFTFTLKANMRKKESFILLLSYCSLSVDVAVRYVKKLEISLCCIFKYYISLQCLTPTLQQFRQQPMQGYYIMLYWTLQFSNRKKRLQCFSFCTFNTNWSYTSTFWQTSLKIQLLKNLLDNWKLLLKDRGEHSLTSIHVRAGPQLILLSAMAESRER